MVSCVKSVIGVGAVSRLNETPLIQKRLPEGILVVRRHISHSYICYTLPAERTVVVACKITVVPIGCVLPIAVINLPVELKRSII